MLAGRIKHVPVVDIQCDEIWGFVGMKEKARLRKRPDEAEIGDAYCYVGLERESKLILAWHLGRRSPVDTEEFADKLWRATRGHFQITTDGYKPYQRALPECLGSNIDFAVLVKHYATKDDHKYSPGEVSGVEKKTCCGNPNPDKICTSHVERQNLTIRMQNRRMTRLTNAFSKKWANHQAALALHFAYYNFCRVHTTLTEKAEGVRMTPAMAAGLEDRPWTLQELVEKSTQS
jgi:IS1 family transposase